MARAKSGLFKHATLKVRDDAVTNASKLSVRQSILPIILVTTLYFLWVRSLRLCPALHSIPTNNPRASPTASSTR